MRTADDLIARAEADNRGVALIPLSEPNRDISLQTPGAARVRLKQIKPQAARGRTHRRAAGDRAFLAGDTAKPNSSGCPTASTSAAARISWPASRRIIDGKPITVIEGGLDRRTRWPAPKTPPAR